MSNILIGGVKGKDERGGEAGYSHITFTLKRGTITFNFKSVEPHLKFIRSPIS